MSKVNTITINNKYNLSHASCYDLHGHSLRESIPFVVQVSNISLFGNELRDAS
jgi:hypothetical protein